MPDAVEASWYGTTGATPSGTINSEMAGFDSPFHGEETVIGPDGTKFTVRVARTAVHRWNPLGGFPNIDRVLLSWVRYLRRGAKTWTVSACKKGFAYRDPFVSEEFPDRPTAARRADQPADAIARGELPSRRLP